MMSVEGISVIKVRNVLLVTVPTDPDDDTISAIQKKVLQAMEQYEARGLVLDISTVHTLDSFFARTIVETAQMVSLMGGRTVIAAMQRRLTFGNLQTALDVDRALSILEDTRQGRSDPGLIGMGKTPFQRRQPL